ncbi:carboxymuconolactone decarboxylase family protein [Rathayibacter sp. KR2-224]|uniref:carboxymuconolactone decarboxylase family protein n=1 Tax=Rathayibacter sp. KR2-224 TaxID=3400913 RepID=UPI003BFFCBA6
MARINALSTTVMPKFVKYIVSANRVLDQSTLPASIDELVNIRASQINGCGACLDMHIKDAAAAGESPLRLSLVAAWRETTVFTDAERAALELTEQATRLADGHGIDDAVWADAAAHFDDEQLAALVARISLINAFNRMNVILQEKGGSYDPAHRAAAIAAATAGSDPAHATLERAAV